MSAPLSFQAATYTVIDLLEASHLKGSTGEGDGGQSIIDTFDPAQIRLAFSIAIGMLTGAYEERAERYGVSFDYALQAIRMMVAES